MAENEQNRPENYFVSQHEPEAKPPPALETGVLKWIRENLANSTLNAILTLMCLALIYFSITGLSTWVVRDANWFSVTANFRNFMLGRYEASFEWRATWTLYISVFAMGAAIAVWVRQIARTMLISIIVIILTVQILPPVVNSTMDLPSWYTGAGNVEIAVAQVSEAPFDEIAFIGEAGDEITIRFASEEIASPETLGDLNGFVSDVANLLRNLSANRLEDIATYDEYTELVTAHNEAIAAGEVPVLTQAQFDEYSAAIEAFEEQPEVIEYYNLNQIPVLVEILNPETEPPEVISSTVLTTNDDVFEATLPADGWYVLRKVFVLDETAETDATAATDTAADEAQVGFTGTEGIALLDVQGIYPSAKRESNIATAFTRRPDGFIIEGRDVSEPVIDGVELPFIDIIRNQYRGERPLNHYLRTYVSPFFTDIGNYVTIVLLIGIAGYVAAEVIRMQWSMALASKFASYLLGSIPVILWLLINGIYLYSVLMWVLVAAMFCVAYIMFKLGQSGRLSGQSFQIPGVLSIPLILIVGLLIYYAFVNVLVLTGDFDLFNLLTILPLAIDAAAVPRFLVWAGIIIIPFAGFYGQQLHVAGEDVKTNFVLWGGIAALLTLIVLGLTGDVANAIQTIAAQVNINLPPPITLDTEWFLEPSDARNWGGLLLTVMLTVYGIIIAFPIGVGLALGRRSDLPLIKYLCTAYIELVRGSPFITVLFFAQLFIPLINPEFNQVPGSYRAIVATIAFSAAYLAENVRGGLQSLPPGQEEAAKALGLNAWQSITLITLPQALRAVIPALVGQFISLFKDTTLVAIVGLIDLVGFVNSMVVQGEFFGTRLEGLLFISIIFFVVSYVMSYVSRLLEASGSGSTRRM